MKIEMLSAVKTEVEVALPVFRRHDIDTDGPYTPTYFTMITTGADSLVSVCIMIGGPMSGEIRIDEEYSFDGRSGIDYELGRGRYKSSREEFLEAFAQYRTLVERVERMVTS